MFQGWQRVWNWFCVGNPLDWPKEGDPQVGPREPKRALHLAEPFLQDLPPGVSGIERMKTGST